MRKIGVIFCLFCLLLTACLSEAPQANLDSAETALADFFQALSDGAYGKAAALYGGSYDGLQSLNPSLSPDEHAALWQYGCALNGYQCLPLLRVVSRQRLSENEFLFTIEFRGKDGKAFVFGPCCGASAEDMPPVSRFDYHVTFRGGDYFVQDEPVFVP